MEKLLESGGNRNKGMRFLDERTIFKVNEVIGEARYTLNEILKVVEAYLENRNMI